jgi:hypothetical protein
MRKRLGRLHLNRETLRRLDDELAWIEGGVLAATGTCLGSGCEECKTIRGTQCLSDNCPVEVPVTVVNS